MKYPELFLYYPDITCNIHFVSFKGICLPLYIEYFTFKDLVFRFAGKYEIDIRDGKNSSTLSNVLYFNSGKVWQIWISPKLFRITNEIRMVN